MNVNDMDSYADELNEMFTALSLKNVIMVGQSTSDGDVDRYIGRQRSVAL